VSHCRSALIQSSEPALGAAPDHQPGAGQAGETRLSFNDRGGDRLRGRVAIDRETFYDEAQVGSAGLHTPPSWGRNRGVSCVVWWRSRRCTGYRE
jgi:hypothetical protein